MIDYNWIDNLKVGDEVITYGGANIMNIQKVTAINKATIKVGETLYNKKDGRERGGSTWSAWHIMEATEDRVAQVKLKRARNYLRRTLNSLDIDNLSMEQIEKILKVVRI